MDDHAEVKRTKWLGVEVEGDVKVLPCRQGGPESGLAKKVKTEFGLGK